VEGGWALVSIFAETHHLPYFLLFDIVESLEPLVFTLISPFQDQWQHAIPAAKMADNNGPFVKRDARS